jgi:hypothetical protein
MNAMQKTLAFLLLLMVPVGLLAQRELPINRDGEALKAFYHNLDVEHLWIAGSHVNWETGEADKPDATSGNHTHCSAFVAAACKRLNTYILRPPEHKQQLLANAQYDWLATREAQSNGWRLLTGNNQYVQAQQLANEGKLVVAVCKNPDETKPGHTALVMPSHCRMDNVMEDGPFLIMAGTHNFNKIAMKNGFKSHITEWPSNGIALYYNANPPQLGTF